MLIPIFGTPSPLTYWVSSVARIICDTLQGSHLFITPVSLEDLKSAWNERNERAVVMQLEIPQREVIDIFIDIGAPMYMAVDDPVDVTIYTQTSRDLEFRIAVKLVSQSFSILSDVYACGNIELIDPLWYNLLPAEFLRRFISRLHLKMSDEQQREILHKITKEKPNASSVLPLIIGNNFHARVPGAYSAPGGPHEESIIRRIIPSTARYLSQNRDEFLSYGPAKFFQTEITWHMCSTAHDPFLDRREFCSEGILCICHLVNGWRSSILRWQGTFQEIACCRKFFPEKSCFIQL